MLLSQDEKGSLKFQHNAGTLPKDCIQIDQPDD